LKNQKLDAQCWAGLRPAAWHCWPGPAAKSAHGADAARMVSVRSVARSPAAQWWSVGDEVLPVSTRRSPGWHRARWAGKVLTIEGWQGSHHRGLATVRRWRSSGWRRSTAATTTALRQLATVAARSCSTRGPRGDRQWWGRLPCEGGRGEATAVAISGDSSGGSRRRCEPTARG
jgi:hypothetical protein